MKIYCHSADGDCKQKSSTVLVVTGNVMFTKKREKEMYRRHAVAQGVKYRFKTLYRTKTRKGEIKIKDNKSPSSVLSKEEMGTILVSATATTTASSGSPIFIISRASTRTPLAIVSKH